MKKLYLLSLLVVVLGLASCNDDEPEGGGKGMIYDFGPICGQYLQRSEHQL